jgi:hypothetical protein
MKDTTFVMARFPSLQECNRYKDVIERPCRWETFKTDFVLDCRNPPLPGPQLTCEQRPAR